MSTWWSILSWGSEESVLTDTPGFISTAFTYECRLYANDMEMNAIRGQPRFWNSASRTKISLKLHEKVWKLGKSPESHWIMSIQGVFSWGRKSNRAKRQKKWGREKTPRPTKMNNEKAQQGNLGETIHEVKKFVPERTTWDLTENSRFALVPYSLCSKTVPRCVVRRKHSQYEVPASLCRLETENCLLPIMENGMM